MVEETFIDRLDRKLREHKLSDRAASMLASGKPDLIRDIRRKGYKPKQDALVALAEMLETTTEWLAHGVSTDHVIADRRTGYETEGAALPLGRPLARDLPVFGTVLGGDVAFDGDTETVETHILELTEEIDWVRRPPVLENRRDVYALYISGTSMEPRFEPGDPVLVDPKRSPKPGDDVIVQITAADGQTVQCALIKRLVRRSAGYVELRQYNPERVFRVPVARIAAIHRVLMMGDIIG